MNAVLAERVRRRLHVGGIASASGSSCSRCSPRALLLFVAAQTGFIDGPRVMANMAVDSLAAAPLRVAVRPPDHEGRRVLMGGGAIALLVAHRAATSTRWSSCTRSTCSSPSRSRTSA